jgi:N,N'-diacetyllegionaminate synthase
MSDVIRFAGRAVGAGQPCLVIAEAGVNHNGDLDLARQLVNAAADAGADVVKFQTFAADTLVSPEAPQFPYVDAEAGSQHEMLRRLELPHAFHDPIRDRCRDRDILFLSTPFHESDADWLDRFGVPAFKIPSGEVTNLPFVRHVADKGKPVILSTGMATLGEVERAVETFAASGNPDLMLLHCVSDYPADPADANLRAMDTMRRAFGVPVGLSDHTPGIAVALAAVALGACVVEKHLTLDRALPGPDHAASLVPAEMTALVDGVRVVESSLGTGRKRPVPAELETAACVRKSLVAVRDLAAGDEISADAVAVRRPGTGLSPDLLSQVLGRRLSRPLRSGQPLTLDDLT